MAPPSSNDVGFAYRSWFPETQQTAQQSFRRQRCYFQVRWVRCESEGTAQCALYVWRLRGSIRILRDECSPKERRRERKRKEKSNAVPKPCQSKDTLRKAGIGRTSVESPPLATERSLERAGYVSVDACAPRAASTTLTFNAKWGSSRPHPWGTRTGYVQYIHANLHYLAHTPYSRTRALTVL